MFLPRTVNAHERWRAHGSRLTLEVDKWGDLEIIITLSATKNTSMESNGTGVDGWGL